LLLAQQRLLDQKIGFHRDFMEHLLTQRTDFAFQSRDICSRRQLSGNATLTTRKSNDNRVDTNSTESTACFDDAGKLRMANHPVFTAAS
jgi:hypothetical protein